MPTKKWYESRVLWTNILAIVGDIALNVMGHPLPVGWDITALGILNMVLRLITKHEIAW